MSYPTWGDANIELYPPPTRQQTESGFSSLRGSLDGDYYESQHCDVYIHDNNSMEEGGLAGAATSTCYASRDIESLTRLKKRLAERDTTRTRWINIVGWSRPFVNEISQVHLGNSGCLNLKDLSRQALGGPVKIYGDQEIVWIQSQIWFVGGRDRSWSSMRSVRFCMVICLPTSTSAGTLITNFTDSPRLAEEASSILTMYILESHPLGNQSLGCAWILAFATLRALAEQLDFVFDICDPISIQKQSEIPQLQDLPALLEKSNNLTRLDRYLSSLEEFVSFLASIHQMTQDEHSVNILIESPLPFRSPRLRQRAKLETTWTQAKVQRQQKLCSTYIKHFETLVQMMLSFSTTQISTRLNSGSAVGEKLARIGMALAGISCVMSPISLLTGFYGMNVVEFSNGGQVTLYDFWQMGMPILLFSIVCMAFLGIWLITARKGK